MRCRTCNEHEHTPVSANTGGGVVHTHGWRMFWYMGLYLAFHTSLNYHKTLLYTVLGPWKRRQWAGQHPPRTSPVCWLHISTAQWWQIIYWQKTWETRAEIQQLSGIQHLTQCREAAHIWLLPPHEACLGWDQVCNMPTFIRKWQHIEFYVKFCSLKILTLIWVPFSAFAVVFHRVCMTYLCQN